MSSIYSLLLLPFIILSSIPILAQQSLPELLSTDSSRTSIETALDSVYNLRYDAASEILSPLESSYPDHPLWPFWDGFEIWWYILTDLENTTYDDAFVARMEEAAEQSKAVLDSDADHKDALVIAALSYGFLSRHQANRRSWFRCLRNGEQALTYLNLIKEGWPQMKDLGFGDGLKLYYLRHLEETNTFYSFMSWAFPKGDKQKGLALLRETVEEGFFLKNEAAYFLGNIYQYIEQDHSRARKAFSELNRSYPRNTYYAERLIPAWANTTTYKTFRSQSDSLITHMDSTAVGYSGFRWRSEYQLGKEAFMWHRYEDALRYLTEARSHARTHSNKPDYSPDYVRLLYYLARTCEKMNQTIRAKEIYTTILTLDHGDEIEDQVHQRLRILNR